MPLSTQQSLLCILLFWTTVISIVQAVFFILFFMRGHNGLVQNGSIAEPTQQKHLLPIHGTHSTPSPSCKDRLSSSKGKMLSFSAKKAFDAIEWFGKETDPCPMSDKGTTLAIKMGGYYYLNLRVTLRACEETQLRRKVSLKIGNEHKLEGWFNTNTNSTGLLSKVARLSTGDKLNVTIVPPTGCVSYDESLTHLHIIYLPGPDLPQQ